MSPNANLEPNFYQESIESFLKELPAKEFRGEYLWDIAEFIHYIPQLFDGMKPNSGLQYMKFSNSSRREMDVRAQLKIVAASYGEDYDLKWENVWIHGDICDYNSIVRGTIMEEISVINQETDIVKLIFRYAGFASQKDLSPHLLVVLSATCESSNGRIAAMISPLTFHTFRWTLEEEIEGLEPSQTK